MITVSDAKYDPILLAIYRDSINHSPRHHLEDSNVNATFFIREPTERMGNDNSTINIRTRQDLETALDEITMRCGADQDSTKVNVLVIGDPAKEVIDPITTRLNVPLAVFASHIDEGIIIRHPS